MAVTPPERWIRATLTSGVTLSWKLAGRNKRSVVLDLKDPVDLDRMRVLVSTADVLVENFRPGTLERLGLAPDDLLVANPRLVITAYRASARTGHTRRPVRDAGRGDVGFAAINGEPDGGRCFLRSR